MWRFLRNRRLILRLHYYLGTHILGASRGGPCDSTALVTVSILLDGILSGEFVVQNCSISFSRDYVWNGLCLGTVTNLTIMTLCLGDYVRSPCETVEDSWLNCSRYRGLAFRIESGCELWIIVKSLLYHHHLHHYHQRVVSVALAYFLAYVIHADGHGWTLGHHCIWSVFG